MATATREEIFDKVQSTLVDALGVDAEEGSGNSTLTGDLGAESIDFLDIVFTPGKEFRHQDTTRRSVPGKRAE